MAATKDRLTPRQEAFAQHVAMGTSLADAYRMAGFNASGNHVYEGANKLMRLPKVRERADQVKAQLDGLRQRAMQSTLIVTAQSVSAMLDEAYADAKMSRQHGAQVAAAMGLAKLHGLLVDKTEDVTRKATRDPDAPIEIDVEHWVTEQSALLLGQSPSPDLPVSPAPSGEGEQISEPPVVDDMGLGALGALGAPEP